MLTLVVVVVVEVVVVEEEGEEGDETSITNGVQGLAPEPVDKVKSTMSESHEPMVDGIDIITTGMSGCAGGWMDAVTESTKGHVEQFMLREGVHSPLMVLGSTVMLSCNCNREEGSEYIDIAIPFDDN